MAIWQERAGTNKEITLKIFLEKYVSKQNGGTYQRESEEDPNRYEMKKLL